jgi:hypothetical protein
VEAPPIAPDMPPEMEEGEWEGLEADLENDSH